MGERNGLSSPTERESWRRRTGGCGGTLTLRLGSRLVVLRYTRPGLGAGCSVLIVSGWRRPTLARTLCCVLVPSRRRGLRFLGLGPTLWWGFFVWGHHPWG